MLNIKLQNYPYKEHGNQQETAKADALFSKLTINILPKLSLK